MTNDKYTTQFCAKGGGWTDQPSFLCSKGQCCNAALLVVVNTTLWLLHTVEALQIFYPNKQENFC